jgi:hypothetical protein
VETPAQGVIVTLSGNRDVDAVSRDLKRAGLRIDQVLEPTGIVTGKADPGTTKKLRQVRGVADVSADHPVDIGPPDSDVQ